MRSRPPYRKPLKAVPIQLGRTYRRRQAGRRYLHRLKIAAMFGGVALSVFGVGMLITNIDAMAIPGAAWVRVPQAGGECEYISVHDGDTIRCGRERVRLKDIDAPELPGSPRCKGYRAERSWCDDELGYKSRDELREFLARGTVTVLRHGQDKYGRTLAIVQVDGVSAGEHLIGLGLAKPWR